MTRPDRTLAWIVLAVIVAAAVLGLGRGLSQGAAGAAKGGVTPDSSAVVAVGSTQPRQAGAPLPLDENRVHEIAREEADAAIARARPKKIAAPKPAETDPPQDESPAAETAPSPLSPQPSPAAPPA